MTVLYREKARDSKKSRAFSLYKILSQSQHPLQGQYTPWIFCFLSVTNYLKRSVTVTP